MTVHIIIFCYILLAGDTAVLEVDAHDCGYFPSFTNGITEYPNKVTTSGSAVHLSCEKRYRLQGTARRVCSSSGWVGGNATCVLIECHEPPKFLSAQLVENERNEFPVATTLTYQCRQGYLTVTGIDNRINCSQNGSWTDLGDLCKPVMCPKPEVKDGHVVYENGPENQFNTSVTFKCNEGFTNRGSLAVACNKDGHWDPPLPTCEGFHNKTVGEYPTRLSDGVRTSDVPLGNTEGVHNKTVGENPARLSYGVRTSDVPLGNTEGIHNKTVGDYSTRLSYGVSTSDVPLGNTEGIHNKTVGEYSTRLSYGVSTSDVPLGNTEGPTSADVRKLSTVVPDVGGTSDASLGRTEGSRNEEVLIFSPGLAVEDGVEGSRNEEVLIFSPGLAVEDGVEDITHMPWYLLLFISLTALTAFLFCVGGVMFIIYMKKCRGSYFTNECKESPQSQRSSISANGEQTSLILLTTATV